MSPLLVVLPFILAMVELALLCRAQGHSGEAATGLGCAAKGGEGRGVCGWEVPRKCALRVVQHASAAAAD